jgi:hypothetical protein
MEKDRWYILPERRFSLQRIVKLGRQVLHHLPEVGYSSSRRAKLHPNYITQEERIRQIAASRTPEEEVEWLSHAQHTALAKDGLSATINEDGYIELRQNRWDDQGNYHTPAEEQGWCYPDER